VGEVKEIKEQLGKLQQDRNSKPSGGSQPGYSGACHICGSKDHWANSCPNKGATPAGGAPVGGPCGVAKHGLDDAANLKVIALIKEQEKVLT
jgi:Zinc knuckle